MTGGAETLSPTQAREQMAKDMIAKYSRRHTEYAYVVTTTMNFKWKGSNDICRLDAWQFSGYIQTMIYYQLIRFKSGVYTQLGDGGYVNVSTVYALTFLLLAWFMCRD